MKGIPGKIRRLALGFTALNLCIFCIQFQRPKKRWEQDTYECAVVLGCPAAKDGQPSAILRTRVEKAVELWREKKVGYLIMSGGAVRNSYIEAEVMKDYARKLGVPSNYILEEKGSVSTYHNLLHVSRMMERCAFRDCVVVTSRWHLRKADHYARKQRLRYVMVPSENPVGYPFMKIISLYMKTSLGMYRNMWRGYY